MLVIVLGLTVHSPESPGGQRSSLLVSAVTQLNKNAVPPTLSKVEGDYAVCWMQVKTVDYLLQHSSITIWKYVFVIALLGGNWEGKISGQPQIQSSKNGLWCNEEFILFERHRWVRERTISNSAIIKLCKWCSLTRRVKIIAYHFDLALLSRNVIIIDAVQQLIMSLVMSHIVAKWTDIVHNSRKQWMKDGNESRWGIFGDLFSSPNFGITSWIFKDFLTKVMKNLRSKKDRWFHVSVMKLFEHNS